MEEIMTNILMVEDDSTIAFGVKYALEQEGFNVDICKDLESSRENIEKKRIRYNSFRCNVT